MTVPHDFLSPDGAVVRRLGYGAMRLTSQPGNFGPVGTAGAPGGLGTILTRTARSPWLNSRGVSPRG